MKKEYRTNQLYVVYPSIVLDEEIQHKKQSLLAPSEDIYKIRFRQNKKDAAIATTYGLSAYENIFNKEKYIGLISKYNPHCLKGEFHVRVYRNDVMPLINYLWSIQGKNSKLPNDIIEFILNIKPYYSLEELKEISTALKQKKVKKGKEFIYKLKASEHKRYW